MTDKAILMSGPMVRALLAGRKSQTRRTFKHQPADAASAARASRFSAGDRLWVRETFAAPKDCPVERRADLVNYRATPWATPRRWTPALRMPRWASRLTLLVTAVRVQRLKAITALDAEAEGLRRRPGSGRFVVELGDAYEGAVDHDPRQVFRWLWESIHGAGSWTANPWVAAITFEVVVANIDALDARGGPGDEQVGCGAAAA